jgi:prepilin-type processing-associated H-X9-DG protein
MAELIVASAAIGMMLLLAAPAVNKGRAEIDRQRCENNLRVLSQAQLMFANVNGGFPPMALTWTTTQYRQRYSPPGGFCTGSTCPGGWYDDHGWYSLIGPYIGEPAWAATINYTASFSASVNSTARRGGLQLKVHACPADIGLQKSEWNSNTWARVLSNYVVNAGNTVYGQNDAGFLGAPFAGGVITPPATVTDGLSNTLLMSEKVVIRGCIGWAGSYAEIQTALGGQMITGRNPPNPTVADGISYGRNGNGDCGSPTVMDARYMEAGVVPVPLQLGGGSTAAYTNYLSARSKHRGGVNVSMCDGSVGFVANSINPAVWRALTSARGAEGP